MSCAENACTRFDRRSFLGASTAAVALASVGRAGATEQEAGGERAVLPMRPLGKTGVKVTILNLGTFQATGLDRVLRFSFANGVRMFDTAKSYGSEPGFKRWFQAMPEVRKQLFLVTKDTPREPKELIPMLDQRLASLGVDHIDLFFIHALGDRDPRAGVEWPKSAELGRVIEQIKKSGKARFVGFSSHHRERAAFLQSAAEGGFVDAIMLQYTPWLAAESALNRALDACHAKGIGLISMKQVAGQYGGDQAGMDVLKEVERRVPMLKDRGLSPFQGLLQSIWTDERISACCVSMRNTDQIRDNAEAARTFEPIKKADLERLRDAAIAAGPMLCADCDGRCAQAAGTTAWLGDVTRILTYHEHHGCRTEARRQYAALPAAARDWSGADLAAAREACPNSLDFATLMPRADRLLS